MQERSETFKANPTKISPETIEEFFQLIINGGIELEYDTYQSESWSPILSEIFQMYKIQAMWKTPLENVFLKDGTPLEMVQSDTFDYVNSACQVRSLIAGAFDHEAKRNKLPQLKINEEMKYVFVVPEEEFGEYTPTKEGGFIIGREKILERWSQENPEFFELMTEFVEFRVSSLSKRTFEPFEGKLSEEMSDVLKQKIEESWRYELTKTALHTYAMFTPNPPEKIPVPVGKIAA